MQTDRTIPVENSDPDQMDTLEDNILSDQMDISDDDQMDWQEVEPLAPGMTNLQIESCLKGYPATCAAPTSYRSTWESSLTRSSSIRTRPNVAEVTGWRLTFHSWDPPNFSIHWEMHRKRITSVSPTS